MSKFFSRTIALPVASRFESAAKIQKAGVNGVASYLKKNKIRFQLRTIERIVAWSALAAVASELAAMQTCQWKQLNQVRLLLKQQILEFNSHIDDLRLGRK